MECCWIPEEEEIDLSQRCWKDIEDDLYEIFLDELVRDRPMFDGLPVHVRNTPQYARREESFWHLTCQDEDHKSGLPEDRTPDMNRCRRIRWPRAFIENYEECMVPNEYGCKGVYIWTSTHKQRKGRSKERVKMFLEDERYLVVLEKRRNYYLLITAHYVADDGKLQGIKGEMRKKGAKYAGSAG